MLKTDGGIDREQGQASGSAAIGMVLKDHKYRDVDVTGSQMDRLLPAAHIADTSQQVRSGNASTSRSHGGGTKTATASQFAGSSAWRWRQYGLAANRSASRHTAKGST